MPKIKGRACYPRRQRRPQECLCAGRRSGLRDQGECGKGAFGSHHQCLGPLDRSSANVTIIPGCKFFPLSFGNINCDTPQSKQTKIFGKTQTVGISRPFIPGKWMFISALNSRWLADWHDAQDWSNTAPPTFPNLRRVWEMVKKRRQISGLNGRYDEIAQPGYFMLRLGNCP